MDKILTLQDVDLSAWTELMNKGTIHAVSGLSEILDTDIKVSCFNMNKVSTQDLFHVFGGAETEIVAVYVSIQEGAAGHILLAYPPKVSFEVADMMLGNAPGTTKELGELEQSALSEMGNIVAAYFLSSMADNTGVRLQPSTPEVLVDMAGAILSIAMSDIMQYGDDIFMMETTFTSKDREINGAFLVLPSTEFLDVVKKHTEKHGNISWE